MTTFDVLTSGLDVVAKVIKELPGELVTAQRNIANDLAFDARKDMMAKIKTSFNNPVPFVQKSPLVKKATKQNLQSLLYIDPRIDNTLLPQVKGGLRPDRRVTYRLVQLGVLQHGDYLTYNKAVVNKQGNIAFATWKKILAEITKANGKYFYAQIKNTRAIWERRPIKSNPKRIRPIVWVTRNQPSYRSKRLDFYGAVETSVAKNLPARRDAQINRILRKFSP